MNELTFRLEGTSTNTTVFSPAGSGGIAETPEAVNDLGWPPAGKDTNNYRSDQAGLSLHVPRNYSPIEVPQQGTVAAVFLDGDKSRISITMKEAARPIDMDELLPLSVANLKSTIPGYIALGKRPLRLAGNVPAVMVTARGENDSLTLVTLIVIDGMRLISVSAASRGDHDRHVGKLQQIVQGLRLFAPSLAMPR